MADTKSLCMELLKADSEAEVIAILTREGYWDNSAVWRYYGDREGNYSIMGNQSSLPEAALVEKLVNCIDSRLMAECLKRGIDPSSSDAPQSIREAVGEYFEGRAVEGEVGGTIGDWSSKKRTTESENITLAVSGGKRTPCITIADNGEGQTPESIPTTFLSLTKSIKRRIKFVQGQWNQGGSGAMKFCGNHGLQLVISRRNPEVVAAMDETGDTSSDQWGFTIVRRERPKDQVGDVKSSVYTFLAPLGADKTPKEGGVLRFQAESLSLMPEKNSPYQRDVEYGSAIKLYDYDMKAFPSHILMPDGLLGRLETRLTDVPLPIRLHECRDYKGKDASFDTTLAGLSVRLEEGKGGNLEPGFPDSVSFQVQGEKMVAKIYAFAKNKAKKYRKNEGVIFTLNGQTHGTMPKSLFSRPKRVRLGRLADSLLVTVDCSNISDDAIEDLFMTSRDRLSAGEFRREIEKQLEQILANHPALRKLQNQRINSEVEEKLADDKPLADVLGDILKLSPTLASLFQPGKRLSRPYSPELSGMQANKGSEQNGSGGASGNGQAGRGSLPANFQGQKHPTYFRFHNKADDSTLVRNCEVTRTCRIKFETDVENDYFSRKSLPGDATVEIIDGPFLGEQVANHCLLHDGIANWSIELPDEAVVGDEITLQCTVNDETLQDPITNVARVTVLPKSESKGGSGGRKNKPNKSHKSGSPSLGNGTGGDEASDQAGNTGGGSKDGEDVLDGFSIPKPRKVKRAEWEEHGFDEFSACRMYEDSTDDGKSKYTFYVNVDNLYLQSELKGARNDVALIESRFLYGQALIALGLLHQYLKDESTDKSDEDEDLPSIDDRIQATTKALAPFLVPMITYLGALDAEEVLTGAETGDEE